MSGREELLVYLIGVAQETKGAEVWRALFAELLSAAEKRKVRTCSVCGEEMDVTDNRSSKQKHDRCSRNVRMQRWREKKKQVAV